MTRIVAGTVGGRTLAVPRAGTRPTSERVREALFSRLEHLDVVEGARVLDLYAGSGALGIEAASRGAAHVTLVESARDAADVCRRNVAALELAATVQVVAERAERFAARPTVTPWDLVLADPPYDLPETDLAEVLQGVEAALTPHAVVVVERAARTPEPTWPTGLVRFDRRAYGDTVMWFAELAAA
ncbi:16S rRNA (guanine(966)-N(2))-methyltransferase RsmD [Cellulomonas xylanilytica]|uniref:Methyltransferase n=1 Tax=Cellulomonas xylanilytica TaxID=233583 RepID=A0A510V3X5_9CELL|nr:16S rRNA (guanine(966)-N(2))-methyltransferase RsmD [Cellulomonas xylanilytica]GEK21574.1 methyltransferase [Cellulomonas xylanilytica]